jgi:hypothetical protein
MSRYEKSSVIITSNRSVDDWGKLLGYAVVTAPLLDRILHRSDENASGEVAPLLAYLPTLQRQHQLAVLVVHHARKSAGRMRAGQALRGSFEFHAWGDSNLYLRRSGGELSRKPLVVARSRFSQPSHTLLVLPIRRDKGLERPGIVSGHGILLAGWNSQREHRDSRIERDSPAPERYIEEWERRIEVAIETSATIPETERTALVQARRGQGIFRDNVSSIEHACRIARVERMEHLIGSHIQPWRDGSNEGRLDGANGLLLTPTVDHLFDKGFIWVRLFSAA